ncbi:MAG: MBOAT family protein [Eubacterium sp.]|jgi:alginate O-acetyltransferase complex protein AlgI|nr:MBOAT family protein [Eubacterium sp.]
MLFNSYIFLFLFLPAALAGYYVLNYLKQFRLADVFLIGMSLWFYGYFNPSYVAIICGSIAANFVLSKAMERAGERQVLRICFKKLLLAAGICGNLAVIFYFKYFNFFLENVNAVFGRSFELRNIVLPLGISFFTFQQVSYLVDSYRGETKGYAFREYALFVSFFPQLVAGPIVLHNEIIPQFQNRENRRLDAESFARDMYLFAEGLFKKVMIADTFGNAVNFGFGNIASLSSMEALIVSVSYTFQLYFDFSGYCDMACGIGNMFHIELPWNFNSPYKALSVSEFWERWHMSLTRFLRNYVYIPLGGNRKGMLRTCVNIMTVYLVSGIWHGADWTFVLWGILHGVFSCFDRLSGKWQNRLGEVTRWAVTFMLVNMLWILFRADDIASAKLFIARMCSLSEFGIRAELYQPFQLAELVLFEKLPFLSYLSARVTGLELWVFLLGAFFVVLNLKNSREAEFHPTPAKAFVTVLFVSWSVFSLSGISSFLYFDF